MTSSITFTHKATNNRAWVLSSKKKFRGAKKIDGLYIKVMPIKDKFTQKRYE